MNCIVARIAVALAACVLLCGQPTSAAESAASNDVLGAVGIGVKDLAASVAFYSDVLGLRVTRRFELGYINEVVLGFPDGTGASIVLMNWPNDAARRYDGGDVKLVFYVDDPAAVLARIRARGGRIDREAAPIEALNGTVVGLGRDPDNYVVELIARSAAPIDPTPSR
jgi:catechol 2,3-dioxygenase-like lactoylglutathione lyase family enzyme